MHSLHAVLFFYITLNKLIRGDYECLCNYNRGASVFPQMNTQLTPSGHLYKFECKPTYQVSGLGQNWTAIQYKRQVREQVEYFAFKDQINIANQ